MSYATGTTHYNLPITVGSDKRDWADTNQAFQDIDAALYQASEDATSAGSGVTALDTQINGVGGIDSRLTQAEHDIDNVEGDVSTLQSTVSGHTTAIADVRRDLQDAIVAYNEPTATSTHAYAIGDYFFYNDILYKATAAIAVGDTIVPNTNCSATNVMTEVTAASTPQSVTAADVTYDNTTSGLTADDVQEAIDEIVTSISNISGLTEVASVTGDGTKTWATLLTELQALVPNTLTLEQKINSKIVVGSTGIYICIDASSLNYEQSIVLDSSAVIRNVSIYNHTKKKLEYNGTTWSFTNESTDVFPNGTKISLYA